MLAQIIKGLGEHYGFTPQQVGEMTAYQVAILLAKDPEEAGNMASGKVKISYQEFRRLTNGR